MVASALRPAELDEVSQHSDTELHALIEPARQQLWAITLLFFAILVIFTYAAILLGRRALQRSASQRIRTKLNAGALWFLVGGLVFGLVPVVAFFLVPVVAFFALPDWFYSLPPVTAAILVSIILAGTIGSAILGGVALSRPTLAQALSDTTSPQRAWRIAMRLCFGAATLIGLAAFALLAYAAQFVLAFYLRFVF
jgi:hypothetical protein